MEFFERVGLKVMPTDASFYLWVAVPGKDDEAYAIELLEQGIIVAPGRAFGPGGEGYVRVALVPGLSECQKAISLWEKLI
jgi:aspartate/methionine/tyrosine aminotransferase